MLVARVESGGDFCLVVGGVGSVAAVVRGVGKLWVWPELFLVASVNKAKISQSSLSPLMLYPAWLNFLLGNLLLSSSGLAWKLCLGFI